MKNLILIIVFIIWFPVFLYSQVTMGSLAPPDSSAMLDLKPLKKNMGFLGPMIELKNKRDQETIKDPAEGLLVFNTIDSGSGNDIVYKDKFYYWTGEEWDLFIGQDKLETTIEGYLKSIKVPRPAIFYLNGQDIISDQRPGIVNPLENVGINQSFDLPLKDSINHSDGNVQLKEGSDNILVFQPGVYNIVFAYVFVPINTGSSSSCKISSYFMDFPIYSQVGATPDDMRYTRVYSNTYHNTGLKSAHGASINFVSSIKHPTEWNVSLGVGSAGNCPNAKNFALPNRNTFFCITKIGEWKD